jgi:uncharacterized protein (DUF1778 family)
MEKSIRKRRKVGGGVRSVKTEGYIVQSIRMLVDENNLVREAAAKANTSINLWCVEALTSAAEKAVKGSK